MTGSASQLFSLTKERMNPLGGPQALKFFYTYWQAYKKNYDIMGAGKMKQIGERVENKILKAHS